MNKTGIMKFIIDLLFPNRCPCCGKFIKWNKLICDNCIAQFPEVKDPICIKCGKVDCICHTNPQYEYCIVATYYDGVIKKGIVNFKLKNGVNFAEYFSKKLIYLLRKNNLCKNIDIVTAVPMARQKRIERGYNQSEVLAKYIARSLKKPLANNIIKKKNKKLTQHKLTYLERKEYVKGSFIAHESYNLKGKTVLLCDDVITSSATLNECAKMLKKLGAKEVICAVISSTNKKYSYEL